MVTKLLDLLEPHVFLEAYIVVLQVHALLTILTSVKLYPYLATLGLCVRVFLIIEAQTA